MTCMYCGAELPTSVQYCSACKQRVRDDAPGPASPRGVVLATWAHLGPLTLSSIAAAGALNGLGAGVFLVAWIPAVVILFSAKGDVFVASHALESLNFQLFWLFAAACSILLLMLTQMFAGVLVVPAAIFFSIYNLVQMIRATRAAQSSRYYVYKLLPVRLVR